MHTLQRPKTAAALPLGFIDSELRKLKRPLWDLEIAGPPGEHLPYWDQISYTRFLFDFR